MMVWVFLATTIICVVISVIGYHYEHQAMAEGKTGKQLKAKHEELMLDNSLRLQKRRRLKQQELEWEVAYRKALEEAHKSSGLTPKEFIEAWEDYGTENR